MARRHYGYDGRLPNFMVRTTFQLRVVEFRGGNYGELSYDGKFLGAAVLVSQGMEIVNKLDLQGFERVVVMGMVRKCLIESARTHPYRCFVAAFNRALRGRRASSARAFKDRLRSEWKPDLGLENRLSLYGNSV